jgi:hypothetical protein
MNYELAKKSLSELIKACGDRFHSITHSHGKSFAYGFSEQNLKLGANTDISSGECNSDKEAVKKLLLKINK